MKQFAVGAQTPDQRVVELLERLCAVLAQQPDGEPRIKAFEPFPFDLPSGFVFFRRSSRVAGSPASPRPGSMASRRRSTPMSSFGSAGARIWTSFACSR
jgi:hypothetical protein